MHKAKWLETVLPNAPRLQRWNFPKIMQKQRLLPKSFKNPNLSKISDKSKCSISSEYQKFQFRIFLLHKKKHRNGKKRVRSKFLFSSFFFLCGCGRMGTNLNKTQTNEWIVYSTKIDVDERQWTLTVMPHLRAKSSLASSDGYGLLRWL